MWCEPRVPSRRSPECPTNWVVFSLYQLRQSSYSASVKIARFLIIAHEKKGYSWKVSNQAFNGHACFCLLHYPVWFLRAVKGLWLFNWSVERDHVRVLPQAPAWSWWPGTTQMFVVPGARHNHGPRQATVAWGVALDARWGSIGRSTRIH